MVVAIDTNVFIYWAERNPDFFEASRKIIEAAHDGKLRVLCSDLIYTEIFYGDDTAFKILGSIQNLTTVPLNASTAQLAGILRHTHGIKAPDAVHLATAIASGADAFITNDVKLLRLSVPGIKIQPLA